MYCSFCGSKGHNVQLCPKTWGGSAARSQMRCTFCGSRTHNTRACPKTFDGNAARAFRPRTVENDHIEGRRQR